ncbi:MAG: hypothetical protein IKQ96_11120, partial [Lachnospiraceae bacterium]|nr:hypothetical protein [Lachnospiraceae bacterium]
RTNTGKSILRFVEVGGMTGDGPEVTGDGPEVTGDGPVTRVPCHPRPLLPVPFRFNYALIA